MRLLVCRTELIQILPRLRSLASIFFSKLFFSRSAFKQKLFFILIGHFSFSSLTKKINKNMHSIFQYFIVFHRKQWTGSWNISEHLPRGRRKNRKCNRTFFTIHLLRFDIHSCLHFGYFHLHGSSFTEVLHIRWYREYDEMTRQKHWQFIIYIIYLCVTESCVFKIIRINYLLLYSVYYIEIFDHVRNIY